MLRYGKSSLLRSDMKNSQNRVGFALPTVMITSILMLAMLLVALQITTATTNSLRVQYYNQLAREAAESGLAMAEACIKANDWSMPWQESSPSMPLTPATDCKGIDSGSTPYIYTIHD